MKPLPSPRKGTGSSSSQGARRVPFTDDDDRHLARYLAEHSISREGRLGNKLYVVLMENVSNILQLR